MPEPNFVHLHLHSEYSLLDGACNLSRLIEQAVKNNMPAIALTDHGNMFGAIEFYKAAKSAGIKPIIGVEAYLAPRSRFEKKTRDENDTAYYHIVLLAKNQAGYKNLIKLSSIGYTEGFYYRPRIDKEVLSEHTEGLIATSACPRGEVPQHILAGRKDKALEAAAEYRDMFGEGNFYIEVQSHGLQVEKDVIGGLIEVGKELKLPIIATNDVHYLHKQDAAAHEVLLCIQTNNTITNEKRFKFGSDEMYFRTAEEMLQIFPNNPEFLANTVEVAEKCNLELDLGAMYLPKFPLPEGFHNENEYLEHEARKGLKERYKDITPDVEKRFNYELDVIERTGYSGYFLIVQDFINEARRRGIPVGPGRGSAAGSLIAFCLGITQLDPLHHGLLFERFLNPDRISMPDIDIDFCYERRGEIIQYVREKYGRDNVAQIITFGRMLARAVIRDVGRAIDLPLYETDRIAKLIPNLPGFAMNLEEALAKIPNLAEIADQGDEYRQLLDHSKVLEGLVRHASVHAAGVVIAPGPLTDYVPIYKTNKDEITTQYDMNYLEDIGLMKMDFLGLKTLTVIQGALKTIAEEKGVTIDLQKIPLDDRKTYKLLADGKTAGVFQFEGSNTVDLLKRMKPDTFEDLVAVNALIRPGPLDTGMTDVYVRRKNGKEAVTYLHPKLEPILKNTYAVITFQEQIMMIANALAGFSLAEADSLRKAVGKKNQKLIDEQLGLFVDKCVENGVDKKTAKEIAEQIKTFGRYGFNKSHSAAYSLISHYTAYLKANYPKEFMSALMTSEMDNTDKLAWYISECRDLDIPVLPPDVNESGFGFTVVKDGIRFGLGAVKNVGRGAIESIMNVRQEHSKFANIWELCEFIDLRLNNKRVIESLVMAGALDSLEGHRAQLFEVVDKALSIGQQKSYERDSGQINLFGEVLQNDSAITQSVNFNYPPLPEVEPWSSKEQLAKEKEVIGYFVSDHPLRKYEQELKAFTNATSQDFAATDKNGEVKVGGIITNMRRLYDRKGNEMAFITLEDFLGSMELIAFSDVFEKYLDVLDLDALIIAKGNLSKRDAESPRLILREAIPLEKLKDSGKLALSLRISQEEARSDTLSSLQEILIRNRGKCPVIIKVKNGNGSHLLRSKSIRIDPTEKLIKEIESLIGNDNVRLMAV